MSLAKAVLELARQMKKEAVGSSPADFDQRLLRHAEELDFLAHAFDGFNNESAKGMTLTIMRLVTASEKEKNNLSLDLGPPPPLPPRITEEQRKLFMDKIQGNWTYSCGNVFGLPPVKVTIDGNKFLEDEKTKHILKIIACNKELTKFELVKYDIDTRLMQDIEVLSVVSENSLQGDSIGWRKVTYERR